MLRRLPYRETPADLQKLIDELQQNGDYLVVENDQRQAIACVTPLPDADEARRDEAARKLREILASVPESPYSEEETVQHINEAIAAIRRQASGQPVG